MSLSVHLPTYQTAIWGLPGYTFKGIYKELQKHLGSSVQNYIVAARTAQGYDEWHNSSQKERLEVISRWQSIQVEVEKEKQLAKHGNLYGRHCYLKSTNEERKKLLAEKGKQKKNAKGNAAGDAFAETHAPHPVVAQVQNSQESDPGPDGADFEEAIRESVAATSRGNPEEDQMIERAIRASVRELYLASKEDDDNQAIQRAIQASVAEAIQSRSGDRSKIRPTSLDRAGDHKKELAAALQRSVQGNQKSEKPGPLVDFDDSGVDTDDDEDIKAAVERSKSTPTEQPMGGKDEQDFQTAIELSRKANEELEQGLNESKMETEEAIVLEYVKRQSLAEEEFKKSVTADRNQ